jgi:Outer membrane receptor for ferrienterochelin and colicins
MMTHVRMLPSVYATVSLAALAFATPAFAQAAPEDDREIVVTAQKRSESIQSIPIAVTALDQKSLESATRADHD